MKLFEPLTVGTLRLKNRIVVPTHAAGAGRILGTEREAERFIAYYVRRARGGAAWIGGSLDVPALAADPRLSSRRASARCVRGSYRHPLFVERHRRYMDALHARARTATVQMIIQGGLPHGASPARQRVRGQPGRPARADARRDRRGRRASTAGRPRRALEAEVDGLELHANHDDLLQFFLSPLSNRRDGRVRRARPACGSLHGGAARDPRRGRATA